MPYQISNRRYFSAIEVCRAAGISKSTLLRWLKHESFGTNIMRDRRGWRLFSEKDLQLIKDEANKIEPITDNINS
jgi:hypothetical protein